MGDTKEDGLVSVVEVSQVRDGLQVVDTVASAGSGGAGELEQDGGDARMTCIHCKSRVMHDKCLLCNRIDSKRCTTCHDEVIHDVIKVQNIHICGSGHVIFDDGEPDIDAFKKATDL